MGERESMSHKCPQEDGTHFCLKVAVTATDKLSFFSFVLNSKNSFFSINLSFLTCIKTLSFHEALIFIFIINFSISLFSSKENNQKLSFFLLQLFKKKDKSFEEMDQFVNLKETELRLGLPGTDNICEEKEIVSCCNNSNKRALPSDYDNEIESSTRKTETSPPKK